MFTKPLTIEDLKTLFLEGLLNHTTKVSKISDDSVLSGVGFGVAKVAQKAMKDIALIESQLFVESAYGDQLDLVAERFGISGRFGASGSSTYVRLVGPIGTFYDRTINTLTGSHGVQFEFEQDVTISIHGFAYAKVRSTTTGKKTNVDPNTLITISPIPAGHEYVTNEVMSWGGRDAEDDQAFRKRIKEVSNLCARGTIKYLEQVLIKLNNNILRVIYAGVNDDGQDDLVVVTQNGQNLTVTELDDLLSRASEFLSITELKPWGYNSVGVVFRNPYYHYIDIDFRVELDNTYDPGDVRKDIQVSMMKYLDFRYWDYSKKVEWDDLLQIVKSTRGVKYVPDTTFYPQTDTKVPISSLPRLRSFTMRDIAGTPISSIFNVASPIFYPNTQEEAYQQTVLYSL